MKFYKTSKKKQFLLKLINRYIKSSTPFNIEYKLYPEKKTIRLPSPRKISSDFNELISLRSTTRQFSTRKISIYKLSTFLKYSLGENHIRGHYHRYYPSAGGRYPLECYIFSFNSSLHNGIYHYNVKNHSLDVLKCTDKLIANSFSPQLLNSTPSLLIVLTTITNRTTRKYGLNGRLYPYIEAGHVGQNIQLIGQALHINTMPIGGGFDKEKIEMSLGILNKDESVCYLFALGYEP